MKKYNIRNIAFLILIAASIFSYTYLSCVSIDTTTTNSATTIEESTEEASIYIPEVTLAKKLIEIGKKIR